MQFEAWKTMSGSFDFRCQVDGVDLKTRKNVLEEMDGWNLAGEILPFDSNNFGLLFSKKFETQNDFFQWIKTFSYPIKVYNPNGDKVIREKKKEKKVKKEKKIKRKKRCKKTCSLCGKKGHTRPTCPKKDKIMNKKGHKCSICCEYSHNAATCPNR